MEMEKCRLLFNVYLRKDVREYENYDVYICRYDILCLHEKRKCLSSKKDNQTLFPSGESVLICREGEQQKAKVLMTSSLPAITSCLQQDASLTSSMKRAILEVVRARV